MCTVLCRILCAIIETWLWLHFHCLVCATERRPVSLFVCPTERVFAYFCNCHHVILWQSDKGSNGTPLAAKLHSTELSWVQFNQNSAAGEPKFLSLVSSYCCCWRRALARVPSVPMEQCVQWSASTCVHIYLEFHLIVYFHSFSYQNRPKIFTLFSTIFFLVSLHHLSLRIYCNSSLRKLLLLSFWRVITKLHCQCDSVEILFRND